MSTLELAALILMGEFALIAWAILFLMLRRQRKQMHTERAQAGAVMEHIETQEVSRRDTITNLFEKTYLLEGEELQAKVEEYVAREKAFYNAMLSLFLSRDGAKLKEIPDELAKVLTPWASITPSGMIHASEMGNLEQEKTQLAAELDNTKQTLEQLMDEYMAAFKRDQPESQKTQSKSPLSPTPVAAETPPAASQTLDESDFDVESGETPTEDVFEASDDEDPIDQAALDAMLDAFGSGLDEAEPASPSADEVPAESKADDEDALAREELDGLADLFNESNEKK